MLKLTYLLSIFSFLISCHSVGEPQTPLELYQKIYQKEQFFKKLYRYSISRRKYFYVFDNNKNVFLIENFKENNSHHLDFNKKVQISKEKEEEIYEILYFMEEYKIISVQGNFQEKKGWERIEFMTNENQVLVYYDNLTVKNNLSNLYKSFKVITDKWGQYDKK